MKKCVVFYGGDSQTGTTMIAVSAAEMLADIEALEFQLRQQQHEEKLKIHSSQLLHKTADVSSNTDIEQISEAKNSVEETSDSDFDALLDDGTIGLWDILDNKDNEPDNLINTFDFSTEQDSDIEDSIPDLPPGETEISEIDIDETVNDRNDPPKEEDVPEQSLDVLSESTENTNVPEKRKKFSIKKKWVVLALLSIAIAGYGGVKLNDYHTQKVEEARKVQELEEMEALFEKAASAEGDEAEQLYLSAIEKYPDDPRGYIGLIEIYGEKMDFANACEMYLKGKETCSNSLKIQEELIKSLDVSTDVLLQEKNLNTIIQLYKDVLALEITEVYFINETVLTKIVQCYLLQNNPNTALEFINSIDSTIKEKLTYTCYLHQIYTLLNKSDYDALIEFYRENKTKLYHNGVSVTNTYNSVYYYQYGKIISVSNVDSSTEALQAPFSAGWHSHRVRLAIFNDQRTSNYDYSKTFCYTIFGEEEYYYAEGTSNGKLTGTATKKELIETIDGDSWIWITSGNVVDDLWDGNLTRQWYRPDGSDKDSGTIYAEKGTFKCISQEQNGDTTCYIYVIGNSGWRWWYTDEANLKGHSYKL